ncbi:MAG: hypothetical protein ABSB95_06490, partial [Dissulfurispiraceae bacterium]
TAEEYRARILPHLKKMFRQVSAKAKECELAKNKNRQLQETMVRVQAYDERLKKGNVHVESLQLKKDLAALRTERNDLLLKIQNIEKIHDTETYNLKTSLHHYQEKDRVQGEELKQTTFELIKFQDKVKRLTVSLEAQAKHLLEADEALKTNYARQWESDAAIRLKEQGINLSVDPEQAEISSRIAEGKTSKWLREHPNPIGPGR